MQIAFGRVRRKTSPAVATEVGVRNLSHRLLKCPFIFGLHYNQIPLTNGFRVLIAILVFISLATFSERSGYRLLGIDRNRYHWRRFLPLGFCHPSKAFFRHAPDVRG